MQKSDKNCAADSPFIEADFSEIERRIMSLFVCHCTLIEQDPSCPVGFPSLLCEDCDGKGHAKPMPGLTLTGRWSSEGPEAQYLVSARTLGVASTLATNPNEED